MKKISLRGKQFAVTKISVHQHDLQPIAVIYLLPGKLLDPSQTNRTPTTKSTLPIKAWTTSSAIVRRRRVRLGNGTVQV